MDLSPTTLENEDIGIRATVFKDEEGNYVLAFAGTNQMGGFLGTAGDNDDNVGQGLGFDTEQYDLAEKISDTLDRNAKGKEITITGHSLGGGLAATAAMTIGAEATTFNAAGVHDNTMEGLPHADQSESLINGLQTSGDILSILNGSTVVFASKNLPIGTFPPARGSLTMLGNPLWREYVTQGISKIVLSVKFGL